MDDALRQRVARIARWNGGSILVVAGLGTLYALLDPDLTAALFAAVIAGAGWIEFAGGQRLAGAASTPTAVVPALVRAELMVLGAIVAYSIWRLATVDVAAELAAMDPAVREMLVSTAGGDEQMLVDLLTLALKLTYGTLILVSLVYQGGLAWWYSKTLRSPA